jgi:putative RecB family exonuclease
MPKATLPLGLYISVSQVKAYLKCPAFYFHKYVRGDPPAFVPVNLAFGSAVHEALAAYYEEVKTSGRALRRDLLLDVFRAAWERACDGAVPLQAEGESEEIFQVVDKGVSLLHAFHDHASRSAPPPVEAVEMPFTVPLRDPDTNEPLEEALTGFIDLLVNDGGRRTIYEHKTSSRRYGEDQLRFDIQVAAYKLAAREAGLGEVALRYQVLVKSKVPAVQVADVTRDAGDEEDFARTVVGVLRAIDAGVSYPVRGWACRSCPYRAACISSTP